MTKANLFTGERMVNHPDSILYQVSQARYLFALGYIAKTDTVLDIACGSGYGSSQISDKSKSTVGADIDPPTISYCQNNYSQPNLTFEVWDATKPNKSYLNRFNRIISFETIEHLPDPRHFLQLLASYLKPGGTLILSTPNNYHHLHPPRNPFHFQEFYLKDLLDLIRTLFPQSQISIFGQTASSQPSDLPLTRPPLIRAAITYLFNRIYDFDQQYLHLLYRLEHLSFYQKIGNLQRGQAPDFKIYPINPHTSYFEPEISLFVITSNNQSR